MKCNGDYSNWIRAAASAAESSFRSVSTNRDALIRSLRVYEESVRGAVITTDESVSSGVREVAHAFSQEYDKLRVKLDGMINYAVTALAKAYADLEKDSQFVTVMLFGRTRAGKSTTMEALIGGDGASIGTGQQHATTEVKAYYFPKPEEVDLPIGPSLRIVDTPGIEGFSGEDLAVMAEEFVERCDHILFLLTDDKASSSELERFGQIRTQGKSVTVLLNVKAADEDLDLLINHPGHIFKDEELDGHKRRISGYLQSHFDMPVPIVIPFHARAAWLAKSGLELPMGLQDPTILLKRSRLADVEARIENFIKLEALPARIRAPRDLLNGYLWSLKVELRPFAGKFREMMARLNNLGSKLELGAERVGKQVAGRIPLLKDRFQAVSDEIPGLVDSVLAARGNGKILDQQWKQLLGNHGVSNSTHWFVESGQRIFEEELGEEVREASIDFEFSGAEDLDSLLGEYHDQESSSSRNKHMRVGLRVGGTSLASGLAGWAVFNWWNPTGWAAAGAAALVAAAGIAGEAIARKATDKWERTAKSDLYAKRSEIIAGLKSRLWDDYQNADTSCRIWIEQLKELYIDTVRNTTKPIQSSSEILWKATVSCLHQLDDVAAEIDEGLIVELLSVIVPEVKSGRILVKRVVRQPGFRTKVLLAPGANQAGNCLAPCIGRQAERVHLLRDALGGERVDFVDTTDIPEMQVLQALGISQLPSSVVNIEKSHDRSQCHIDMDDRLAAYTIGPKGANVRLASALLKTNIWVKCNGRSNHASSLL